MSAASELRTRRGARHVSGSGAAAGDKVAGDTSDGFQRQEAQRHLATSTTAALRCSAAWCWAAYAVAWAASWLFLSRYAQPGVWVPWWGVVSDPLWVGSLGAMAATGVVFLFSLLANNSSVYDPFWCLAPQALTVYWLRTVASSDGATGCAGVHTPAWMAAGLVWTWAVRFHIGMPWSGWVTGLDHEDWRYADVRKAAGHPAVYWMVSFTSFHVTPTLLVVGALLPVGRVILANPSAVTPQLWAAWGFTAFAIAWEGVADAQMTRFRAQRRKRAEAELEQLANRRARGVGGDNSVMRQGLWRYSRHPNYWGECCFWVGVWLQGVATGTIDALPFMAGCAVMCLFFRFASTPLMDTRMKQRKGAAFEEYAANTSAMMPWF